MPLARSRCKAWRSPRCGLKMCTLPTTLAGGPILQGVSFEIPAGQDGGGGRALGLGKIHAGAAAVPLLRHPAGPHHHRRAGDSQRDAGQRAPGRLVSCRRTPCSFNDTVAYNIACTAATGATQQEVEAAARAARIHDLHCRHAQGLRHHGGRAGPQALGRRKQRVAIARTLLENPPILDLRRGHQRAGLCQRTRHPGRAAKRCAKQDHAASLPHRLSPRWWTRRRFWSWTRAASSSAARTRSCWPKAAATPTCGPCNKAMAPPDPPVSGTLNP